jgi:type I restriction-modification system DNA methylase subunit
MTIWMSIPTSSAAALINRNEKLVKLINAVAEMQLGDYKDNTIDAFGDAYEYLMTMYASNAGKSGGKYFTPQEVSELLMRIALVGKTEVNKVYDPACGEEVIISTQAGGAVIARVLRLHINQKP